MANIHIGNALEGKIKGGDQVLDMGTGTGMVAAYLAERFGANVTGVDASSAMLARAAMRVKDIRVGKVALVQGDALSLPVSGEYDAVTMAYLLRHIPSSEAGEIFRQAARVCRPGGCAGGLLRSRPGAFLPGSFAGKGLENEVLNALVEGEEAVGNFLAGVLWYRLLFGGVLSQALRKRGFDSCRKLGFDSFRNLCRRLSRNVGRGVWRQRGQVLLDTMVGQARAGFEGSAAFRALSHAGIIP